MKGEHLYFLHTLHTVIPQSPAVNDLSFMDCMTSLPVSFCE